MTASASEFGLNAGRARSRAREGLVSGDVRALLRVEGFAAFAGSLACYAHAGFSWPAFALLVLAPDLSIFAYLAWPRVGAIIYNVAHTYAAAVTLTFAGFVGGVPAATAIGLIWIAHIGFDRALGYGLKYPTSFGNTHLGRIGRH